MSNRMALPKKDLSKEEIKLIVQQFNLQSALTMPPGIKQQLSSKKSRKLDNDKLRYIFDKNTLVSFYNNRKPHSKRHQINAMI